MGDPSGRTSERTGLSPETLEFNTRSIKKQVDAILERGAALAAKRAGLSNIGHNIKFVNNREWISKMSLLDFLNGPGKRVRVSTMLARER